MASKAWWLVAGAVLVGVPAAAVEVGPKVILAFETMYGVDGPFVGHKIRGIEGDELPWAVGAVRGFLTTSGHLRLDVHGLVFTDDPEVPPELRGINDEPFFRAVVSCLAESEDGTRIERHNVTTRRVPATRTGDAHWDTVLDLGGSCVAPIVLVTNADLEEPYWFAVTGAELEED